MKGMIVNYRSSRHRQKDNHMVIIVNGVNTRDKAKTMVGKEILYKTEAEREIKGKIASAHGNSGAMRVIFEKGMPGQSLSKTIEIL